MENTKILGGKWQLNKSEKIGEGCVYRGKNVSTNDPVAIKEVKVTPAEKDEVLEEIKALKTISETNHPNILKMLDFVVEGNFIYLVLELCEGGNLKQKLATTTYSEKDALALARKVAEGLSALHTLGIPHRAIKAENILFKNGEPKISEFTLSLPEAATTKKSMGHLPPEHYNGSEVTGQFDIWGFGVLLHQILFKSHPCGDPSKMNVLLAFITKDPYKLSAGDRANIGNSTFDLLQKCFVKNAAQRITIAQVLAHPCFTG